MSHIRVSETLQKLCEHVAQTIPKKINSTKILPLPFLVLYFSTQYTLYFEKQLKINLENQRNYQIIQQR